MKIRMLLALLFLSWTSFSQELNESSVNAGRKKVHGLQAELKALRSPESQNLGGSHYELALGLLFKETWQIQYVYGRLNKSKTTSGGDLQEWEYVEEGAQLESSSHMIEIKKLFYNPYSSERVKGFFTSLGYGQIDAKINYDYNRYKPNNGAICFIACDSRVVEESDSATTKASVPFYRVSAGYSYELMSPRNLGVASISAALNYTEYLNKNVYSLAGAKHQGTFDLKELDKMTLNIGFGVMF